jgi:hypothetical protein
MLHLTEFCFCRKAIVPATSTAVEVFCTAIETIRRSPSFQVVASRLLIRSPPVSTSTLRTTKLQCHSACGPSRSDRANLSASVPCFTSLLPRVMRHHCLRQGQELIKFLGNLLPRVEHNDNISCASISCHAGFTKHLIYGQT